MLVTITVALAGLAVLGAIVVVAVGGGGELSAEHPDHPPLALPGRRTIVGTDAALLRLPLGLWGYHKDITDEALDRLAHELTDRETRIAILEQELAEARQRLSAGTLEQRRAPALPAGQRDEPLPAGAEPLSLPAGREDPTATRAEAPRMDDTETESAESPETATDETGPMAISSAGDPWKTILDSEPSDNEEERAARKEGGT